jgi:hypothetical protein
LINHRISTTIKQKYWELLNKHVEKYGTQQKVLEVALENLEHSSKQSSASTWEDRYWMLLKSTKLACCVQKDCLRILIKTADTELFKEYVTCHKPMEYAVEYYLQKPLKESSLKDVINGLVIISRLSNWFDTVDQTDDGGHFTLIITHSLGLTNSKLHLMAFESLFETYGVKTKSTISEKTIFVKIFKN